MRCVERVTSVSDIGPEDYHAPSAILVGAELPSFCIRQASGDVAEIALVACDGQS